ncbi:hypothetical protein [Microvirga roseola]|nr:hypothetical protein [Microvirga roseola]
MTDGNLALVDAGLQAYGDDTYIDLQASALAMDEFSSMTASAIMIA